LHILHINGGCEENHFGLTGTDGQTDSDKKEWREASERRVHEGSSVENLICLVNNFSPR